MNDFQEGQQDEPNLHKRINLIFSTMLILFHQQLEQNLEAYNLHHIDEIPPRYELIPLHLQLD